MAGVFLGNTFKLRHPHSHTHNPIGPSVYCILNLSEDRSQLTPKFKINVPLPRRVVLLIRLRQKVICTISLKHILLFIALVHIQRQTWGSGYPKAMKISMIKPYIISYFFKGTRTYCSKNDCLALSTSSGTSVTPGRNCICKSTAA